MRMRLMTSGIAVMALVGALLGGVQGTALAAGKVAKSKPGQEKASDVKTCDCCAACAECKSKAEADSPPAKTDEAKDRVPPNVVPGGKDGPGKENAPGAPAKIAPAKEAPIDSDRIGLIRQFAPGSTDWLIREAFKCAMDFPDESRGFECYAALNVESNHDNETATTQLRIFQWKYFRRQVAGYMQDPQGFAFHVTRREPGKVEATAKEAKIFLRHKVRENPAPITLRREGGVWKIYANSLGF